MSFKYHLFFIFNYRFKMSTKFDSNLFYRTYSSFKKIFQKYMLESKEQGSIFVIDIRVLIAD